MSLSLSTSSFGGATLESVARKVAHLPGALPRVAAQIGKDAVARVGLGFRRQADPYDNPWAPHAVPRVTITQKSKNVFVSHTAAILRDRGILANSYTSTIAGTTVRVGSNVFYAAIQQTGNWGRPITVKKAKVLFSKRLNMAFGKSVTLPARPMLPTKAGGMPAKWSIGFVNIARTIVRELLK